MEEHRITIDGDMMSQYNLVSDLDEILSKHGIHLEIEDVEHDGYDIVIVTINKNI